MQNTRPNNNYSLKYTVYRVLYSVILVAMWADVVGVTFEIKSFGYTARQEHSVSLSQFVYHGFVAKFVIRLLRTFYIKGSSLAIKAASKSADKFSGHA